MECESRQWRGRILSAYRAWKEWHCGAGRYRVVCGDRLVGYVADQRGVDLLISADSAEERMYAPLESRKAPKFVNDVAID